MTHRFFAALSLLVCATANAKTIEGQVFIVTAGGPAIKLALVQVGAIPPAVMEKYLADVEPKINAGRRDAESAALEAATAARKATTAAEAYAKKTTDKLRDMNTSKFSDSGVGGKTWKDYDRAQSELKRMFQQEPKLRQQVDAAIRRFHEAEAHRKMWCSAAPYFVELPQPIATAKTDADGRFQMNLPDDGDYILVAKAERTVFKAVEKYYWVIRLRQGRDEGDAVE
jgi:hypothetical protein